MPGDLKLFRVTVEVDGYVLAKDARSAAFYARDIASDSCIEDYTDVQQVEQLRQDSCDGAELVYGKHRNDISLREAARIAEVKII